MNQFCSLIIPRLMLRIPSYLGSDQHDCFPPGSRAHPWLAILHCTAGIGYISQLTHLSFPLDCKIHYVLNDEMEKSNIRKSSFVCLYVLGGEGAGVNFVFHVIFLMMARVPILLYETNGYNLC